MSDSDQYGEISLPRLNLVYRYAPDVVSGVRPYLSGCEQLGHFFRRNFAWIGLLFLYLTAVLTAMQVALAVPYLMNNAPFHCASYGFSIFCIVVPLVVVAQFLIPHAWWFFASRLLAMRKQRPVALVYSA